MSLPNHDLRISALADWLRNELAIDFQQLEAVSGDASFRRYFRVFAGERRYMAMDAPPALENTGTFIRNAELFKAVRVRVPDIYHQNTEQGFLLLEDFGTTCLLDCLAPDNAGSLYELALNGLFVLQTGIAIDDCPLPHYDNVLLRRELELFGEWFLEKLLGLSLPTSVKRPLHDLLIDSALAQPQVCVHRDYHSRNLMRIDGTTLGVLDFQDAVVGPITYDLASLLRDCYIRWPQPQVESWTFAYYRRLRDADLLEVDFAQFKHWFDLMGLQRHLKAVGIFARLHLRDGKPAYLRDIPRTMDYIAEVCASQPALQGFKAFLHQQVLPVYRTAL